MGYLLALFAIAALGLLLAGAGQVWRTQAQREREAELLFVGQQFRQALGAYYSRSPGAVKQFPQRLEDLIEDARVQPALRHLRRIYRDPMTGSTAWGLVRSGDRIVAVHSLATTKPIKTAFEGDDAAFSGATRYDQWIFRAAVLETPK
jgi:type II secretory pathway pseudopilin PulG